MFSSKIRVIFLTILTCFFQLNALTDIGTQTEFTSFIPSTADDLVNIATGDFSYKIPLLKVPTIGGDSFPVVLFYQAGIGLEQEASWTGLGWNINVGTIIRQTNGLADDFQGTISKRAIGDIMSPLGFNITPAAFIPKASSHSSFGDSKGDLGTNESANSKNRGMFGEKFNGFDYSGEGDALNRSSGASFLVSALSYSRMASKDIQKLQINCPVATIFGYEFSFMLQSGINSTDLLAYGLLRDSNIHKITTCDFSDHVEVKISDGINAYPYFEYSCGNAFLTPAHDYYSVNCEGISGTFTCYKKGLQEALPWQGLTHRSLFLNPFDGYAGFAHSTDYTEDQSKPVDERFRFMYLGDKSNKFIQTNKFGDISAAVDLEKARKVIPLFSSGIIIGFRIVDENGYIYYFDKGTIISDQQTRIFGSEGRATENSNPNYYSNWIIKSITGPDYIDLGNAGFDDADKGFWIEYRYETTSTQFKCRIPFTGSGELPSYGYNGNNIRKGFLDNVFSTSTKNVQYLRNIITNKAVAVFSITKRDDGYESNSEGTGTGTNSYYRLDKISLYDKAAFSTSTIGANNCWDDDEALTQPLQKVGFTYDYSLCPKTPNSNAASTKGKLTLKALTLFGRDNNSILPYQFSYGNNPEYSSYKYDRWGYYKKNGALYNHLGVNTSDAAAWSLNRIKFPTGANIDISYEADRYNFVHNEPVIGTKIALGEQDVNNVKGIGGFFTQDERPAEPTGNRVYEIRSFAPGGPICGVIDELPKLKESCSGGLSYSSNYYLLKTTLTLGIPHPTHNLVYCEINSDELPEDFKISSIVADAYCGPSEVPAGDPLIDIEIKGFLNGNWHYIKSEEFTTLGRFDWIRRGSYDLRDHPRYEKYSVCVVMKLNGLNIIPPYDVYQRDLRVFFIDNINPTNKQFTKFGGGIRVKQLIYNDGLDASPNIVKSYYYDDNGDGSGINSGVATIEPEPFNFIANDDRKVLPFGIGALIPGQIVYYGKVTVKTRNAGSSCYELYTPLDKPITVNSAGRHHTVTNPSAYWGGLKKIIKYNDSKKEIFNEVSEYEEELGKTYEEINANMINADALISSCPDQSSRATEDDQHWFSTQIWNYYPTLSETATKEYGVIRKNVYEYNTDNGEVRSSTIKDVNGNVLRKETITYAYEKINELGHKNYLDNSKKYYKNILRLPVLTGIQDGDDHVFEVTATTMKSFNESPNANLLWFDQAHSGCVYKQWRQASRYLWNGNNTQTTLPVFDFSPDAINSAWVLMDSVCAYDNFGQNLIAAKPNTNNKRTYTTTVYGHKNRVIIGTISNAKENESAVFTCDYDLDEAGNFDKNNLWAHSDGALLPGAICKVEAVPHFGQKSLYVKNAKVAAKKIAVNSRTTKITWSAWVQPKNTNPIRFAASLVKNGVGDHTICYDYLYNEDEGLKADGTWQLVKFDIDISKPAGGKTLPEDFIGAANNASEVKDGIYIWIGNYTDGSAPGAEFYIDDIRIYPKTAIVTSTYYEQKWYQPIICVDANNNPGQKVEYDEFGRPVRWYKFNKMTTDKTLLQEKEYHLRGELKDGQNIQLLYPDFGGTFNVGDQIDIQWENRNTGEVIVYFVNYVGTDSTVTEIHRETYSDGYNEWKWVLPQESYGTNRIKVKIGAAEDMSDATFSVNIPPPHIGDDKSIYFEGIWPITWYLRNTTYVKIEYTIDGGSTWLVLTSSTENDGVYYWILPNTFSPTSSCKIRITDVVNTGIVIESRNTFEIRKRSSFLKRFILDLINP
jgi:hypothetical protein